MMVAFLLAGLPVYTNETTVGMLNPENKLVLITLDGFRWQEVFNGADSALLTTPAFTPANRAAYWHVSKEERRKKLLPFFWGFLVRHGKLYGNRAYQNKMNVANPYVLSYPGYNELLTGRVDLSLFGNDKAPNPNSTLLDFLNATEAYRDKVAAFTSWEAFPYILNRDRSRIYLNSGDAPSQSGWPETAFGYALNHPENSRSDEETFRACKAYLQKKQPSVVFLSFSGTDAAAHDRQYLRYLQQAQLADRLIGELWQYLQTLPAYAGKTTLIITTDHGRGASSSNWDRHGLLVPGSSQTWMCLLGSGIPAGGEQQQPKQFFQKDIPRLILRLLALHRGH